MSEQAGAGAGDPGLGGYRGAARADERADERGGTAVAARPDTGRAGQGRPAGRARALLAGLLLPLAAAGLAVAALLVPGPGGTTATAWVTAALVLAWAVCC